MQVLDDVYACSEFRQEDLFPLTESEKNEVEHQKLRREISTLRKSQFARLGELLEQYKNAREEIEEFKCIIREYREEIRQMKVLLDKPIKDICIRESTMMPVTSKMLKFNPSFESF